MRRQSASGVATVDMASSQIDRLVKGAPPPNVSPEQVASAARRSSQSSSNSVTAPHAPSLNDPTSHLPSSPPQIYLNLLILESSLRAQYLSLRARLRLHLLLLGALALWTLIFTYLLFLRPREDGNGTGGSVYWVVDTGEKMGFVGGAVTWGLVWATGIWERGIRWPRKWVGITNRGLRGFNLKVVILRGPWWKELFGYLNLLDPLGWWAGTKGMRYTLVPRDLDRISGGEKEKLRKLEDGRRDLWIEEDIAPGGDMIKLLLLPKPFSPDFREEWDTYRTSYWEKENLRRADLRKLIKTRDREAAKREGGWLWWTGWRGWSRLRAPTPPKPIKEKPSIGHLRQPKKRESIVFNSGDSRSSSRSSTPGPDAEGRTRRQRSESIKRTGSSQGTSGRKKKLVETSVTSGKPSPRLAPRDSRPSTPDQIPTLSSLSNMASPSGRTVTKRASNLSMSSGSDSEMRKEETPPPIDVGIKEEEP